MNYFAHLTLAQPNSPSKVGNLMGDFMRGVRLEELPAAVRLGVSNHRFVDGFTDRHTGVIACKRKFSAQRRRFAGVALDVLFDHFLMCHWQRFYPYPLADAIVDNYGWLMAGRPLMPAPMRQTVERMVGGDWLSHYTELDTVGRALDRIASRIRFSNRFDGCINDIRPHYEVFEHAFLEFYPQLMNAVATQNLELREP